MSVAEPKSPGSGGSERPTGKAAVGTTGPVSRRRTPPPLPPRASVLPPDDDDGELDRAFDRAAPELTSPVTPTPPTTARASDAVPRAIDATPPPTGSSRSERKSGSLKAETRAPIE